MEPDKPKNVGAIWQRTSKAGKEYLSMEVNGVKYIAYKNDYKTEDKHPNWRIFPKVDRPYNPRQD